MSERVDRKSRITGTERSKLAAELRDRYKAGESIRSLSAATGRSYGFIHRLLTEGGVSLRELRETSGATPDREAPGSTAIVMTVQIFVEETDLGPQIERDLLSILDKDGTRADQPIIGSWYRKLTVWFNRASATESGTEVRRGIELHLLDRFQAGIDGTTGDAVAKLITALNDSKGAVIQVGSVLLVKANGAYFVRQLTVREMSHWQRHPELFKDPANALAELQRAADMDHEAPPSLPETG